MTDFPVNTYRWLAQSGASVALDADGDFVVVWQSNAQDGSQYGVYAQRYTAAGAPVGSEFRINTTTANTQVNASVAMDADGDFVVVWQSTGQDGSNDGVYAQRYTADGVAAGSEFLVNTFTTGHQRHASVAMDADGDFVVAWQSASQDGSNEGVYAQRYTADGVAVGSEFRVNTTTTDSQSYPSVAMDADGDFVVAWQSSGQDGSGDGVYAQRYTAAGAPVGSEFRVNTTTTSSQSYPLVAMDADGELVVVWQSNAQDGSGYGIFLAAYGADGTAAAALTVDLNEATAGFGHLADFVVGSGAQSILSPDVLIATQGLTTVTGATVRLDGRFNEVNETLSLSAQSATRALEAGVSASWDAATGVLTLSGTALPSDYEVILQGVSYTNAASVILLGGRQVSVQVMSGAEVSNVAQATLDVRVASEFRVNTFTDSNQRLPSVAMDADGDFVVVWQSNGQDGSNEGVYAQRYTAAGVAADSEFRVNFISTNAQQNASVAMDADGDFVVVWQTNGQDGAGDGIYAQRYNAAGGWLGGHEFPVNTHVLGNQRFPSVAMDADGDFVVVWQSGNQDGSGDGIYAQRYTAAGGVAVGSEFRVNTFTANAQQNASVAMDADGDFVVVWQSNGQDGGGDGIYAQRYTAAGVAAGSEFRVNTFTPSSQRDPSVAMNADGDFVVAWQSSDKDGSSYGVYAQRYTAAGVAVGGEFRVNTTTANAQNNASVAMGADGGLAVAWTSNAQDGSSDGVYAQLYVTNVNQTPVVTSATTASFAENGTGTVYTATATDPDANTTLSYGLSGTDATLFDINASTGVVTFKAAPNFEAPGDAGGNNVYDITVTASDGTRTASQAVAITVTNENEAPAVNSATTASFAENGTGTVYAAMATDPDANTTLSYGLSGDDAGLFDIDASTGVVTFKAAPNFEAPGDAGGNNVYDITVTASDGTLTASRAVAITVTNENEAPAVNSATTASFAENGTGTVYTAMATDPDANTTLSYGLSGDDAGLFDIDASTGAVTFKAAPNFEAPGDAGGNNVYDITVTASDGTLTASQAVAITVTNVNEAPVVTSAESANFAENGTGTVYTAASTDPDGDALSFALGGTDATLFDIDASTGVVTFKAAPNFEAPGDAGGNNVYDITVTASDGTLSSSARAVAITVTNVNEAPTVISAATASFMANGRGTVYTATASDPDAATTLTWALGGTDASRFNINAGTGVVTFKTPPNLRMPADNGADNVYDLTVTASDGGLTASQAVAITVQGFVDGTTGHDLLQGFAGSDTLRGGAGNDTLGGGAGNDVLDGGRGADSMAGGAGDDIYHVNEAGDALLELAGGGNDHVLSAISWTLGAQLERLSLTGSGNLNGTGNDLANQIEGNASRNVLEGGGGHDTLLGGAGNDTLSGGSGNDRLDGGRGADRLVGGIGDDTYLVQDARDVVVEQAGGGIDRVLAELTWTLGAELEWLSLAGSANLDGTGNALDNRIDGNTGRNRLTGGAGADTISGGAGEDTLVGGQGADRLSGDLGADRFVLQAAADSGVADGAWDLILDFNRADGDLIDLSLIDAVASSAQSDQGFSLIGEAMFDGEDATGQLNWAYDGELGGVVVRGSTDADADAEFALLLVGVVSLQESDFIL